MSLLDKLYSQSRAICTLCGKATDGIRCLTCGHLVKNIEQEDQTAEHLATFNKLKKYSMLSTGVPRVDEQVRALHGNWLTALEEYQAILRESKLASATPERKLELAKLMEIRLRKGLESNQSFTPFYELSVRKIPYEDKETGETQYTKLRQLFLWLPPITNSGELRITRRGDSYTCIDAKTGKRVDSFSINGLERFLNFYLTQDEVQLIIGEML